MKFRLSVDNYDLRETIKIRQSYHCQQNSAQEVAISKRTHYLQRFPSPRRQAFTWSIALLRGGGIHLLAGCPVRCLSSRGRGQNWGQMEEKLE